MTDSEVIDLLGGTHQVARGVQVDPRVVSNWRKRGISAAGRFKVKNYAAKIRVSLPRDFLKKSG